MKTITVHELQARIARDGGATDVDFINVCTPAEYSEEHIAGIRNVPLDTLADHRDEFTDKKTIYVHCRSGRRGAQAVAQLKELGVTAEVVNVSGGITAWNEAGLPTKSHTSRLPLMRQVFIGAGVLILTGTVLGYLLSPMWYGLVAFVGLGLTGAGITGWCGMTYVLSKMPWNT